MNRIRPDFVPLTVSWNLTRRCSLACAHCYIDASARLEADDESTTRQCRDILRQLAGVNPEALLILTGGEPLIREDIFELIAEATEIGFWTVLGSHGGLLDGKKAERLAAAGLKGAGLSLESASARASRSLSRGRGRLEEDHAGRGRASGKESALPV